MRLDDLLSCPPWACSSFLPKPLHTPTLGHTVQLKVPDVSARSSIPQRKVIPQCDAYTPTRLRRTQHVSSCSHPSPQPRSDPSMRLRCLIHSHAPSTNTRPAMQEGHPVMLGPSKANAAAPSNRTSNGVAWLSPNYNRAGFTSSLLLAM